MRLFLTFPLISMLLAGCSFDDDHSERSEAGAAVAKQAAESKPAKAKVKKEEDDDDLPGEIAAAEVALETARLGSRVTELDNAGKLQSAERAVADKRRMVEIRKRALEHFQQVTKRDELTRSTLSLDRSKHRRELAQDELGELEAMYAEEDLAAKTKELVLKRGRKSLEFSGRELTLTEKKGHTLETFDLPKRLDEKHHELATAQAELTDAERSREKIQIEVRIAQMKAAAEISKAERALTKLQKKLAKQKGGS